MQKKFSFIEKFSVIAAASSVAIAALFTCLKLNLAPGYAEFIVGHLAWNAGTKSQDLLAGPVFILTLLAGLWLFSAPIRRLGPQSENAQHYVEQLLWCLAPVLAILGGVLSKLPADKPALILSNVGLVFLGLAGFALRQQRPIEPRLAGLALLGSVMLALLPFEWFLLHGRLNGPTDAPLPLLAAGLSGFAALMLNLVLLLWRPDLLARLLPHLLLLGQFGLALCYLCLYPARLQAPGELTQYSTTPALKLFVAALVAWTMLDSLRRYLVHLRTREADWYALLSPPALFGLLLAIKAGWTLAPLVLPDDYHFGERVLGWWSYLHGTVPYLGYIPPHGLIADDLPGLLSSLFYDGTAAATAETSRMSQLLLGLGAFLALRRYSGSLGLAFCAVLFIGEQPNWLYLTLFMCLWLSPWLLERPALWLTSWIIGTPLLILGVPPQGLLAAAASGLVLPYMLWRLLQQDRPLQRAWPIGLALGLLLIVALLTPLLPMLFNAIRYVLENGPINQVAYGIPWQLSWGFGERSGFVFELLRMSWTIVPVFCAVMVYQSYQRPEISRAMLAPALAVFVFSLLMIPYSMGRIDPGSGSRPMIVGVFIWTMLLPIAVWWLIQPLQRVMLAVLVVAGLGASQNYGLPSSEMFSAAFAPKIPVSPLRDSAAAGMPNIGRAMVEDKHWERLTRLQQVLAAKLRPGESYLDLSSRNAQYFYLDRLPRQMPVTAPYNLVPLGQQHRALERLSRDLPSIALLEADNIVHDGGGPALRSHYLYRFVLEHYTPALENGFVIGHANPLPVPTRPLTLSTKVSNLSDPTWDRGVHRSEAALVVAHPNWLASVPVGLEVRLDNGELRRINRVNLSDGTLWLEGPPLDPAQVGFPHGLSLDLPPEQIAAHRLALLDRAFAQPELGKIPVAWGRSERSLAKRMTLVHSLDSLPLTLSQLRQAGSDYQSLGNDPQLLFDLSGLQLAGREAGLLRFEFQCREARAEPRFQIFWWGDDQGGASEAASVSFTAQDGTLIVPLDASPRWLTLRQLTGLRIDLNTPEACQGFSLKRIGLYQRVAAGR
ncbi:hypothetical protein [Chitinimonas lacunae]|uniref:Glycosyltransferase RgtA/B/C/D-like domain-containing protein n=1 Tax=Chitinimonas lacunae TaxID=1963018 RepID=A0ABV8MM53_9NEIS